MLVLWHYLYFVVNISDFFYFPTYRNPFTYLQLFCVFFCVFTACHCGLQNIAYVECGHSSYHVRHFFVKLHTKMCLVLFHYHWLS